MTLPPDLQALAGAFGVQTTHVDVRGREVAADPDAVVAVLALLGAELDGPDEAAAARRAEEARRWATAVEPVSAAWEGTGEVVVRGAPSGDLARPVLTLEDGSESPLPPLGDPALVAEVDGRTVGEWRVAVDGLPPGVHHLVAGAAAGVVLSAPRQVWRHPDRDRQWGPFAPLHALRDRRARPVGDVATLGAFARWAWAHGAGWVATLPLLAGRYDDEPVEPSPYRPLSRLAWNELHLDLAALPEVEPEEVPPAVDPGADVDWAAVAAEVHAVLARALPRRSDRRRAEQERFLADHPHQTGFVAWRGAGQAALADLHGYAQWAMSDQLEGLARHLESQRQALYLDLPLGVHPDGYDATAHADAFAAGASVGAPPDDFFEGGQDWGFAPLHPQRSRTGGHPYLRAALAHHCGPAGMLRVDHVMGLHRLWWIPAGFPPTAGVYVECPAEELYAVLSLASHRHRTEVVGEDLGTVPPEVRAAVVEHGLVGMWPAQFAVPAGDEGPPPGVLAVVNTHDMAPFAAFWAEPEHRRALADWLADRGHRVDPDGHARPALAALLEVLGASGARHVQVSVEDLWLEPRPQNRPGTTSGNWVRRAGRDLEDVAADGEVSALVDGLARERRAG